MKSNLVRQTVSIVASCSTAAALASNTYREHWTKSMHRSAVQWRRISR